MSSLLRRLPFVLPLVAAMTLSLGCATTSDRFSPEFSAPEARPLHVVVRSRGDAAEDKRWLMRLLLAID